MIEFKEKEKTFVYDFELLTGEQCIIAEQCFVLHNNMVNKGVKTLSDLEQATAKTALFKGYGTLLLEK